MAVGWNTEVSPTLLGPGSHSVFKNLTLRGGAPVPRPSDEPFTPAAGSVVEWKLSGLGSFDVVDVFDGEGEPLHVSLPAGGGAIAVHDRAAGLSEPLVIPSPAEKPELAALNYTGGANGLVQGERRLYAVAWGSAMGWRSGLSDVAALVNDAVSISVSGLTGGAPAVGEVITNTTRGVTAPLAGATVSGGSGYLVVREPEKSSEGAWTSGDTLTWEGGSATVINEQATNVLPGFSPPAGPPAEVDRWFLFSLDEDTGYWRQVTFGDDGHPFDGTPRFDNTYLPYADSAGEVGLGYYGGPLDDEALPETLWPGPATGGAAAWHKGCLFIADGEVIRYSEPTSPRVFRQWARLGAGDRVMALVSRGAVVEVHTASGLAEIRGDAPYFELWELGANKGPVAARSVAATGVGTFGLADDGIYLYAAGRLTNLTRGAHTPWIEALPSPQSVVAGASGSVYYLVDGLGNCLAYDWEADLWFSRSFQAQPEGFLYVEELRALVAKVGGNYLKLETGDAPVEWAVSYDFSADGHLRPLPGRVYVDADCPGGLRLSLAADGREMAIFALQPPDHFRLPQGRARTHSITLDGSSSHLGTVVRGVSHG